MTAYHITQLQAKGHSVVRFTLVAVGIKCNHKVLLQFNAYICLQ